jgi:hypothetical protein
MNMKKLEPNASMKSKLRLRTSATLLFFIISVCATLAQNSPTPPRPAAPIAPGMAPPPRYAPGMDQRYGLWATQSQTIPAIDPTTGLPISQPAPEWKDPNWNDPDKTLPEVFYDGLPVSEIAHNLSEEFKGEFDTLLPHDFGAGRQGSEGVDWISTPVHLRLKNVKASEVFNAMNLLFENNRTPLRWELKINGSRRIALLRVLEDPRLADPFHTQEPKRTVYFVGDLIGSEKSGGMSMADIVNTISEVWKMTYGQPGVIQFHDQAQLLIVVGTEEQNDFMRETLKALRMKAELERSRPKPSESRSKTEEPKSSGDGGSK